MDELEVKKVCRRPRFTKNELEILVDGVERRKYIIDGRLDTKISSADKVLAWKEIAEEVNLVNNVLRSADEVRKKWTDFKSSVKKKAAEIKHSISKTGGGEKISCSLDALEEKALAMIGEVAVNGIVEGLDVGVTKEVIADTDGVEFSELEGTVAVEPPFDEIDIGQTAGAQTLQTVHDPTGEMLLEIQEKILGCLIDIKTDFHLLVTHLIKKSED